VTVVDTSALMAILLDEPKADSCAEALEAAEPPEISAATLAEALVVADRRGVGEAMRVLVAGAQVKVHAVDAVFARRVAETYTVWGKGVHPAGLNIFDCFAYALAREHEAKLLFVGNDFARTDITSALPPAN
jgi:ribonuclease VapC